jgi:hypothetical protein
MPPLSLDASSGRRTGRCHGRIPAYRAEAGNSTPAVCRCFPYLLRNESDTARSGTADSYYRRICAKIRSSIMFETWEFDPHRRAGYVGDIGFFKRELLSILIDDDELLWPRMEISRWKCCALTQTTRWFGRFPGCATIMRDKATHIRIQFLDVATQCYSTVLP